MWRVGGERRLADPRHAFAAHLAEAHGRAVHPDRHVVAADAGDGARAFGHLGRGVVRAAAAEPGRALRAGAGAGDGVDDQALLLGLDQRHPERHPRRDVGVDAEPGEPAGDRLGDDRRREVGLGAQQPVLRRVGLAPLAAGLVALRFVELAEHVRPHVGPPAVELLLELVLDDLALLLDHQDLLEAERELAGDRRLQRPDDVDLVQAQADAAAGLVVEAEVEERLAGVVVGLARGDDAEAVVRAPR